MISSQMFRWCLVAVLPILLFAPGCSPPARGQVRAIVGDRSEYASFASELLQLLHSSGDSTAALWVDLRSFALAGESLTGTAVSEAEIAGAVGRSFNNVPYRELDRVAADLTESVLHVRLTGVVHRGHLWTAYVLYIRRSGTYQYETEERIVLRRATRWIVVSRRTLSTT
jgi:hypothetical protein